MKVVINRCYGGFSLSAQAVARMAELQGKPCFFFTEDYVDGTTTYTPCEISDIEKRSFRWSAFTTPEPPVLAEGGDWYDLSPAQQQEQNERYNAAVLTCRPDNRQDPILVQVVEELGEAANGACAKLKVVEIPDGVEYEIDEYDGMENIHEVHRSWA